MDRRSKIILGIFGLVLLGIIITEVVRPKPINWRASYTSTDKIPFGCYVLFNELQNLFPNNTVKSTTKSPYEVLTERPSGKKSNYIFINDGVDFDEEETNELLDYVSEGNDVFIASTYFGYYLSDTLNIGIDSNYGVAEDSMEVTLTNRKFKSKKFYYSRGVNMTRFNSVDTANTTALGYLRFGWADDQELDFGILADPERYKEIVQKPNFIKTKFGKGNFYLSTTPQAYTNYYLLGDNQAYAAHTLSYLKDGEVYWDNYEKSGRVVIDSPLRFVLNQASLKWAYYLTMVGLLIFVIFRAKREQRIIPVITPLENSSIEFARTVGSLYFQHKDYSNLIAKKLNYFLEYIRSNFYIDTTVINEKTARDLAAKSGKSLTETKELIDWISHLKNKTVHTEQDMITLNKKITSFKQ